MEQRESAVALRGSAAALQGLAVAQNNYWRGTEKNRRKKRIRALTLARTILIKWKTTNNWRWRKNSRKAASTAWAHSKCKNQTSCHSKSSTRNEKNDDHRETAIGIFWRGTDIQIDVLMKQSSVRPRPNIEWYLVTKPSQRHSQIVRAQDKLRSLSEWCTNAVDCESWSRTPDYQNGICARHSCLR